MHEWALLSRRLRPCCVGDGQGSSTCDRPYRLVNSSTCKGTQTPWRCPLWGDGAGCPYCSWRRCTLTRPTLARAYLFVLPYCCCVSPYLWSCLIQSLHVCGLWFCSVRMGTVRFAALAVAASCPPLSRHISRGAPLAGRGRCLYAAFALCHAGLCNCHTYSGGKHCLHGYCLHLHFFIARQRLMRWLNSTSSVPPVQVLVE